MKKAMRNPFTIFRHAVICASLAVVLQPAVTIAESTTSPVGDVQSARKVLEALDAYSPSNPDPKDLVALFQMRTAIPDEKVRLNIEDLVAVGFVIAKRQDLYIKRVRPSLADPSRIEKEGQRECPVCKGEGQNIIKCGRCAGLGHCPNCKGTGKKRVNVDMQMLKGPVSAHQKPKEEFKDIPCPTCKGTGNCTDCNGEGNRKVGCPKCIGTGKVWDAAAANRLAMEAYDALHAALKMKVFEASIPESIATVSADGVRTLAPVFTFGDSRVVAIPARAATGISGLSVYSHDKRPIPFTSLLASVNRDLVLIDLGQSSIVTPLELEANASNLETGRRIYAYGTSREDDMAARLDGKVLAAGPVHISSSIASQSLVDCAPLITDDGKLGGLFMYPMAEFNSSGSISLMQNSGAALRLDNLLPADFIRVTIGDLNLRNNAITFAKRAIKSAKELLEMDNSALALRQSAITDAIKRLDRAVEMLKGVRKWELFMMEATAREFSEESQVRARNLEARLAQVEAEKRAAAQAAREAALEAARAAEEGNTNVLEVVAAPKLDDDPPAKPAKKAAASSGNRKRKREEAGEENAEGLNFNWRKILTIAIVAIVVITVIFILMGVVQDKIRKNKLAEPPKIPDFIREMQEYERRHPEKKK
jgi:hypothetical protein